MIASLSSSLNALVYSDLAPRWPIWRSMAKQNWPINDIHIWRSLHKGRYVLYLASDLMLVTSGSTFFVPPFIRFPWSWCSIWNYEGLAWKWPLETQSPHEINFCMTPHTKTKQNKNTWDVPLNLYLARYGPSLWESLDTVLEVLGEYASSGVAPIYVI